MSQICNNCRFYYEENDQCRRYPPEWPTVTKLTWCGEWKVKASAKLPIEQVTLDEIMTDPKYEEIRSEFIADSGITEELKEPDIENSPAQPVKKSFINDAKDFVKGFGKKENK